MFENPSLFIISSLVFILSPGVDTVFVLNKSITGGVRTGCIAALGVALGVLFHTLFASLGLAIVLSRSEFAFSAVKYLGSAYLIYLGLKSFFDKTNLQELMVDGRGTQKGRGQMKKTFIMATLTNILNPKMALFFMAFFPQFVGEQKEGEFAPFFILGSIYSVTCLIWLCCVAYFMSQFSAKIKESSRAQKIINYISGITFIGLGIKLAFSHIDF